MKRDRNSRKTGWLMTRTPFPLYSKIYWIKLTFILKKNKWDSSLDSTRTVQYTRYRCAPPSNSVTFLGLAHAYLDQSWLIVYTWRLGYLYLPISVILCIPDSGLDELTKPTKKQAYLVYTYFASSISLPLELCLRDALPGTQMPSFASPLVLPLRVTPNLPVNKSERQAFLP